MDRYRITYVNPAFSPRASYEVVSARDNHDAARRFREQVNQACVIKTIGDKGIIRIDQLQEGGA